MENFFTIGYEGLGITRFVQILQDNQVRTLADVRYNPFSRNPDFRCKSLMARMEKADVAYIHLKELGVPSDIRKTGDAMGWYRKNVGPSITRSIFNSLEHPVCFMCMERDLNCCHRKVILDSLSNQGMVGKELYPDAHLRM